MTEREGVIKYKLTHTHQAIDDVACLAELESWRSIFFALKMIGRNPDQYHGLGYGNISQRLTPDKSCFIISGTQTGHLDKLTANHYCLVKSVDFQQNRIVSRGLTQPSSEALTHACVYQQQQSIMAVIHVHCPEIWRHTIELKLPHTQSNVAYGTLDMVTAVNDLFESGSFRQNGIFTMLGHEDGVVAFGPDLETAGITLVKFLALALKIEYRFIHG